MGLGLSTPGLLPDFKKGHNQQFPKPLSSGEGRTYGFLWVERRSYLKWRKPRPEWVRGLGFRVQRSRFGVEGLGFRLLHSGFSFQSLGFRVSGPGFSV